MPPARALLYTATLAAIVVAVRSIVLRPPPVGIALLFVLAYTGLIFAGVFVLRLRMFTDAVVRGPAGARGVVITFDDGPDPQTTPRVLDALDAAGAKATFFVIAKKAERHPELAREIVQRGHAIGLHSYAHDRLFSLRGARRVREDLVRGLDVLEGILGERPQIFRPPIGHTNPTIARVADELGLTIVGWSVSARDGIRAAPRSVVVRVTRRLSDGSIVLLHDASERGDRVPACVAVLPEILARMGDARLDVVPLSRFLGPDGGEASGALRGERQ